MMYVSVDDDFNPNDGWVYMMIAMCERGEWETKDGEILKISEMDDYHIANCIKMLERSEIDFLAEMYIDEFQSELRKRYNKFYNGIFGGQNDE